MEVISGAEAYTDISGRTLDRRINWTLFFSFVTVAILVAILVLQAIGNSADTILENKLSAATAALAVVEELISSSPSAEAFVAAQPLFKCTTGLVVPRKWIIIGGGYAAGNGSSGATWYEALQVLIGGSTETIVTAGNTTLSAQLLSLANNTLLTSWLTLSEPLLVFVEYGYFGSMAAMAQTLNEISDPRAQSPIVVSGGDVALLQSLFWRGASNRIVFLVPTLPYSPPLGGYVPISVQNCTDPLAAALFNGPNSFLTMQAMSELTNAVSLIHALATLASTPPLLASVQILTTDALFAQFGFNVAPLDDVAFGADCLSLNVLGQRLLAQFLFSCLQGLPFTIPTSLAR
jgi:hypothetical protein